MQSLTELLVFFDQMNKFYRTESDITAFYNSSVYLLSGNEEEFNPTSLCENLIFCITNRLPVVSLYLDKGLIEIEPDPRQIQPGNYSINQAKLLLRKVFFASEVFPFYCLSEIYSNMNKHLQSDFRDFVRLAMNIT